MQKRTTPFVFGWSVVRDADALDDGSSRRADAAAETDDAERAGRASATSARLRPLAALEEYIIAPGEIDVRETEVYAAGGRRIGRVHDLLIDTWTSQTRYLLTRLDPAAHPLHEIAMLPVPIGCAQLAARRQRIELRGVYASDLPHAPLCNGCGIEADAELAARRYFLPAGERRAFRHRARANAPRAGAEVEDFYHGAAFDETRFWRLARRGRESFPYVLFVPRPYTMPPHASASSEHAPELHRPHA